MAPDIANHRKMNRAGKATAHAANTAMRFLRYLRRAAALKIVSSETSGNPSFLSFSATRRHKLAFGSAACPGTPWGYSSLITRCARSNAGRLLIVVLVSRVGWADSLGVPARHKTFVTSALESLIHSRSQCPQWAELPRWTNHGFTGRDLIQSRSSDLRSVGISNSLPSSTASERMGLVVCLSSLPRILTFPSAMAWQISD